MHNLETRQVAFYLSFPGGIPFLAPNCGATAANALPTVGFGAIGVHSPCSKWGERKHAKRCPEDF